MSQLGSAEDSKLRVAIAHDFMETFAGAERVTEEMAKVFPDAPIYSLLVRPSVAHRMGVAGRVRSVLPSRPRVYRDYRMLTPVYPAVADRVRIEEDVDVVLSSSYAFAHRFQARNGAPRVCYCYSPLRFAWSMRDDYRARWAQGPLSSRAFEALGAAMRRSDRRAAQGVQQYVAVSDYIANQIERYYGARAEVIRTPVDCEIFKPSGRAPDDYFLFCGRLIEPYKQPTIVVEAFRQLPYKLVVAGDGPAAAELRRIAPDNVEFVGHLRDDELVPLMQNCLATIFPSRDDGPLLPLEVMACGRPLIAYDGGGGPETIVQGLSGDLFPEQTVDDVLSAVRRFRPEDYDARRIRQHAEQWDVREFRRRLRDVVERTASAVSAGH